MAFYDHCEAVLVLDEFWVLDLPKILRDDFALNVYWEIYEFEFDITDSSRVNKIGAFNDGPFKNIGVNRGPCTHMIFIWIYNQHTRVSRNEIFFCCSQIQKDTWGPQIWWIRSDQTWKYVCSLFRNKLFVLNKMFQNVLSIFHLKTLYMFTLQMPWSMFTKTRAFT